MIRACGNNQTFFKRSSVATFVGTFVGKDLGGTNLRHTGITGNTDAELDNACRRQCKNEVACEFWVRSTGSSGTKSCWLKRGATTFNTNAQRRGAFKQATTTTTTTTEATTTTTTTTEATSTTTTTTTTTEATTT